MSNTLRQQLAAAFRKDLASVFEQRGTAGLRQLMAGTPTEFRRLAARWGVSIGPNPTDEQLDDLARRIVTSLRRGTPDEGKPLLKRMHRDMPTMIPRDRQAEWATSQEALRSNCRISGRMGRCQCPLIEGR